MCLPAVGALARLTRRLTGLSTSTVATLRWLALLLTLWAPSTAVLEPTYGRAQVLDASIRALQLRYDSHEVVVVVLVVVVGPSAELGHVRGPRLDSALQPT